MQSKKVWVVRALAVLGLFIIIGSAMMEYQEYGFNDPFARHLPKLLLTSAALFALLVKTFLTSGGQKPSKAAVQAGYARVVQRFQPQDKRAKKIFYRGYAASCAKNYRRSDYWYKRALKAAQSPAARAEIGSFLGINALEQGKYEEARQILRQAVETDKTCDGAWCQLTEVYLACRDTAGAKQTAETGLRFCPQSIPLLSRTGHCAFLSEDYETALRDFLYAQRLDPSSAVMAGNVAVAYAGLGDAQNAYAACAKAQALQYPDYDALLQKVERLLHTFEARRVHYSGVFTLEFDGGDYIIEDCTEAQLYSVLQSVYREEYEFLVLTPPAPIDRVLFMQAMQSDEGVYVQISVGENGNGALYERICTESEASRMFMEFLTEGKAPNLYGFTAS